MEIVLLVLFFFFFFLIQHQEPQTIIQRSGAFQIEYGIRNSCPNFLLQLALQPKIVCSTQKQVTAETYKTVVNLSDPDGDSMVIRWISGDAMLYPMLLAMVIVLLL